MNVPAVSVILPAYNCEKYIDKAIQSVLDQTWSDFELIIINDGSSDGTETIIRAFNDPRIILVNNPGNKGLIFSLNRAIDMAKGNYIARMDADDICLPERLGKQKRILDENDSIAVVATTIDFIKDSEERTGTWPLDRKNITPEQIRKQMPFENCIAHPSVMIRTAIAKQFKYRSYQVNIEDYDLWLRLLGKGYIISKINEPLLLYRQHQDSVTNLYLSNRNFFFKHFHMKRKFLAEEISSGNINRFIITVVFSAILDISKGIGKAVKNIFK